MFGRVLVMCWNIKKKTFTDKQKSLDLQLICCFEHIEAETVILSQMAVDECIVSLRRWVSSEGGRQLLFDLDRECTPVMQTGETLIIFSLTESFQEENAITERHGDANCLLQSPSEQPGGVFHLQSGSLLGMVKTMIQPAGGKLISKIFSSVPSWIRQQERKWIPGWKYHSVLHFCLRGGEFISVKSLMYNGRVVIAEQRRKRSEKGHFHAPTCTTMCNIS